MADYEGWLHSAPSTKRHIMGDLHAFNRALDGLGFADIGQPELQQYMTGFMGICSSFQWGPGQLDRCRLKHDLTQCGSGTCPAFTLKKRSTFSQHLASIDDFYDYLVLKGYLNGNDNWTSPAIRGFARSFRWPIQAEDEYYRPKTEEVRAIISGTPHIHRKAVYATMAKCGLRIHEVCGLRCSDVDVSGWIRVPRIGKRKGNQWLPIDSELRAVLEQFMEWKQEPWPGARRGAQHDFFFTNHQRMPLGVSTSSRGHMNSKWVQADAVRLGLQPAGYVEPRLRWRTHSFRHFFSDHIAEAGIPDVWYKVLRGDRVKTGGTTMKGTYTDTWDRDRIRDYYSRYAPLIGWS